MAKKSDIILGFHKRNALPILRRQLNYMFEKETGHNLHHFFDVIHHHAVRGYKRSNIPGAFEEEGEQVLHRIKRVSIMIKITLFLLIEHSKIWSLCFKKVGSSAFFQVTEI